ncbi:MAG: peptidoglycan-binding protein [Hyphomicrobiaceae bacterium]|nr:peptidoglycan-binding protein [Hyphomicrobiaceae bacterium]
MSPRGFKLGLALFLAMSGLFAAKLSMLGPGGFRTPWAASTSASPVAQTKPAASPAVDAPVQPKNSTASTPPDVKAAVTAETAAHVAPPLAESDEALVSAIKLELKTRGYAIGSAASGLDLDARAGILAYEADNDMRLTGEASQPLLHRLLLGDTGMLPNSGSPPAPRAEEVIRTVQASLKRAGHPDTKTDGLMSREMVETIRAFERAHNMKVTGRISGELVAQLRLVARDGLAVAGH